MYMFEVALWRCGSGVVWVDVDGCGVAVGVLMDIQHVGWQWGADGHPTCGVAGGVDGDSTFNPVAVCV